MVASVAQYHSQELFGLRIRLNKVLVTGFPPLLFEEDMGIKISAEIRSLCSAIAN